MRTKASGCLQDRKVWGHDYSDPSLTSITLTAVWLLLTTCCATAPAATHETPSTWTLGTPIVTYWAGPGTTMPVDDAASARLQAGGWNLGWAAKPEDLDILHRHGLRAMLVIGVPKIADPAQAASLQLLIERVRSHPARCPSLWLGRAQSCCSPSRCRWPFGLT